MTEEQFLVISQRLQTLVMQHSELMDEIQHVWIALVVFAGIGILFIAAMMFAAAWSVHVVLHQQNQSDGKLLELAGKFNLLIEILLEDAKRRKADGQSKPV